MSVFVSILTLIVAALAAALTVPTLRSLAIHRKLLDYPDGDRHHHAEPVPRLGGVAVFAGVTVALLLASLLIPGALEATSWLSPMNRALVAASAILFLIGLLDDLQGVTPALKLFGQTAAAALVIAFGFRINVISFVPGFEFSLGILAVPVTILWLVGVSNALNLVDGLDGLAGGVSVIALFAIIASAAVLGSTEVPLQAIALAGALLGFLYHNRPPARVFLGDSGSLVVGFLLAFLAVKGATTSGGVLYGLVPIFALSYLLLDTGIAILRRWLRGAPLSRADGRHIHHQLLALGLSPRRAVEVIYLKALFIALLGLCVTFVPPQMTVAITAVGATALLIIFMYGIRWLEYHEFLEAGASVASGMRKARGAIQDRILARDVTRLLRSVATLDEANDIVRSHASAFRFVHMEILHEDAAARTVRAPDHIGSATWLLEFPILAPDASDVTHDGQAQPVLAIWCAVSPNGRPANAERVAQILAPEIALVARRSSGGEVAFEGRSRPRPSAAVYPKRRASAEHKRISDVAPNG